MSSSGRSYFPNLNGLRFFAFLHVFITHALIDKAAEYSVTFRIIRQYLAPGFFGIDLFFVLSGFLITWTLLEEKFLNRKIDLKKYLARRTLRIWPLYFLIVITGYLLHGILSEYTTLEPLPGAHWFYLFIVNFYLSLHGPEFIFFLVFMWSVAVEEQFYLLWGILMKFLRRAFPHACLLIILTSLFFRYRNIDSNNMLVFHSLSVAGNLATGALFSWTCFYRTELFRTLHTFTKGNWIRIYVLLFVLYALYSKLFVAPAAVIFEKLIFSILFCLLLFDQCFNEDRLFNAGGKLSFNYLGRISYGLYCFHGLVITFVLFLVRKVELMNTELFVFVLNPVMIALGTLVLAHLSYNYYEKPFLKLKKRFY